jgi:hypothetical protein
VGGLAEERPREQAGARVECFKRWNDEEQLAPVHCARAARGKPKPSGDDQTMGHAASVLGYDWGGLTSCSCVDVWKSQAEHNPVLIVRKQDLVRGAGGYI